MLKCSRVVVNHRVLSRLMWNISGFSVARAILIGPFFIDYVEVHGKQKEN
jgi:hypothetical protein